MVLGGLFKQIWVRPDIHEHKNEWFLFHLINKQQVRPYVAFPISEIISLQFMVAIFYIQNFTRRKNVNDKVYLIKNFFLCTRFQQLHTRLLVVFCILDKIHLYLVMESARWSSSAVLYFGPLSASATCASQRARIAAGFFVGVNGMPCSVTTW